MPQYEKRKVPPGLKKVLDYDMKLTKKFNIFANDVGLLRSLREYSKVLEISCHGIPWFAFWIAFTWLFNNTSLVQLQVNMLIGLLVDIVLVALSKAYFRRKRPAANTDDAFGQMGPDVFSFPSGHASRSVFVAFFFIYLYPVFFLFTPFLLAWSVSVCLSRVLMNRHYILDVVGGVALGLLTGLIMTIFWLGEDSSKFLMSFLSDEKLDGGEYHV